MLSHWGKNTQQAQKGPAGSSHYSRNDKGIWQNMMATKKWAERNVKPSIKGGPAENRKAAHVKRRRKVPDRVNKPPGRGRRMSGKQILDIREGKARVKPRHHQPVPSQYGTW